MGENGGRQEEAVGGGDREEVEERKESKKERGEVQEKCLWEYDGHVGGMGSSLLAPAAEEPRPRRAGTLVHAAG